MKRRRRHKDVVVLIGLVVIVRLATLLQNSNVITPATTVTLNLVAESQLKKQAFLSH